MNSKPFPKVDHTWSLFLDRDGVLNTRIIDDYVRNIEQFNLLPEVPEALQTLSKLFSTIVVVTNQQGVGKGLMTMDTVNEIHNHLNQSTGNKIHRFYVAPQLRSENSNMRKPEIGMALQAKKDFPHIDFSKSIIIGDSTSDMEFGRNVGMYCIKVGPGELDQFSNTQYDNILLAAQEIKKHASHNL